MTVAASAALRPAAELRGTIKLPSDKSIAHRALICAALSQGESTIVLRMPGDDVLSTLGALRSFGTAIDVEGERAELVVRVIGLGRDGALGRLGAGIGDCGNSGTSMRLLAGALASGSGSATLIGDESLSQRPMDRVAAPLRAMDAEVHTTDAHAPLVITGRRPLRSVEHRLAVPSAQVLAAISIASLAAEGTTRVFVPGQTRDHTERMLAAMGASISRSAAHGGTLTTIDGPSSLHFLDIDVPGDFSSAAAWIVAAAIHPDAEIRITDVNLNPTRTALLDVLHSMGADVSATVTEDRAGEPVGDVIVRGTRQLRAISLGESDIAPLIDELPLLAVAMAAADGTSEVRGAHELRVKESDRIAAIGTALAAAGANFEELQDGWRIRRGTPRDARVTTHSDHRIAMAMAVAAWTGVAGSVELDDVNCVAISYPSFWDDARQIGAVG